MCISDHTAAHWLCPLHHNLHPGTDPPNGSRSGLQAVADLDKPAQWFWPSRVFAPMVREVLIHLYSVSDIGKV